MSAARYQYPTATGAGTPIILDPMITPFSVSIWVILTGNAAATFTVEETPDDLNRTISPNAPVVPNWIADANIVSKSATIVGNIMFPCWGIRLNIASLSLGTGALEFCVIQAGITTS